ncbi:MAG: hypothetical protein H6Q04_2398 [Acidobacteria bacterium]|nr:hypothetical protein [Acidobacteriota bacterium]
MLNLVAFETVPRWEMLHRPDAPTILLLKWHEELPISHIGK